MCLSGVRDTALPYHIDRSNLDTCKVPIKDQLVSHASSHQSGHETNGSYLAPVPAGMNNETRGYNGRLRLIAQPSLACTETLPRGLDRRLVRRSNSILHAMTKFDITKLHATSTSVPRDAVFCTAVCCLSDYPVRSQLNDSCGT